MRSRDAARSPSRVVALSPIQHVPSRPDSRKDSSPRDGDTARPGTSRRTSGRRSRWGRDDPEGKQAGSQRAIPTPSPPLTSGLSGQAGTAAAALKTTSAADAGTSQHPEAASSRDKHLKDSPRRPRGSAQQASPLRKADGHRDVQQRPSNTSPRRPESRLGAPPKVQPRDEPYRSRRRSPSRDQSRREASRAQRHGSSSKDLSNPACSPSEQKGRRASARRRSPAPPGSSSSSSTSSSKAGSSNSSSSSSSSDSSSNSSSDEGEIRHGPKAGPPAEAAQAASRPAQQIPAGPSHAPMPQAMQPAQPAAALPGEGVSAKDQIVTAPQRVKQSPSPPGRDAERFQQERGPGRLQDSEAGEAAHCPHQAPSRAREQSSPWALVHFLGFGLSHDGFHSGADLLETAALQSLAIRLDALELGNVCGGVVWAEALLFLLAYIESIASGAASRACQALKHCDSRCAEPPMIGFPSSIHVLAADGRAVVGSPDGNRLRPYRDHPYHSAPDRPVQDSLQPRMDAARRSHRADKYPQDDQRDRSADRDRRYADPADSLALRGHMPTSYMHREERATYGHQDERHAHDHWDDMRLYPRDGLHDSMQRDRHGERYQTRAFQDQHADHRRAHDHWQSGPPENRHRRERPGPGERPANPCYDLPMQRHRHQDRSAHDDQSARGPPGSSRNADHQHGRDESTAKHDPPWDESCPPAAALGRRARSAVTHPSSAAPYSADEQIPWDMPQGPQASGDRALPAEPSRLSRPRGSTPPSQIAPGLLDPRDMAPGKAAQARSSERDGRSASCDADRHRRYRRDQASQEQGAAR